MSRFVRLLLVAALSIACAVALPNAASAVGPGGWDHVGLGVPPTTSSLNGSVEALNADVPGSLYVGGAFTSASGNLNATHIAKWDGTSWSALGPMGSLNGDVHAIATYGGKVYAGGVFTDAGGNADADFLAVWDGSSWAPFCTPAPAITANVAALQVIGTTLYVGGDFADGAGIPSADFLVACDLNTGAASTTVDSTAHAFGGAVDALTESNGTLYAGGQFINLESNAVADHIARDEGGGLWSAMGTGPGTGGSSVAAIVRSLTSDGANVYVGTDGVDIGGIANADNVARWDDGTSTWSAMGADTTTANGYFSVGDFAPTINGLTTSGSDVYATGSFQNEDGNALADDIVRFDGTSWHPVGSDGAGNGPLSANGLAVAVFGGKLYDGGGFTTAGGDSLAHGIACFGQCTFPAVIPTPPPSVTAPGPTGKRAAALKKCKKKAGAARKKCKKKANKLPV